MNGSEPSTRWQAVTQRFAHWFARPETGPALPEGTRIYAIGDIHGRRDLLDSLLQKIEADADAGPDHKLLIFLGDYIDRGPDSCAVVERMLQPFAGYEVHFLRGNHDQALLDFLADPQFYTVWRSYGGQETLRSYGVALPRLEKAAEIAAIHQEFVTRLPATHLAFLNNLEHSLVVGGYFFAHAGVRPGVALDRQDAQDLMWIRDEFLSSSSNYGKIVVHGHTPTEEPVQKSNRIGVDTGAYATGHLTAAVLEAQQCRFLQT